MLFVGFVLLIVPTAWFPSYYDTRFMGVFMIVGVIGIAFIPLLLPSHRLKDRPYTTTDVFRATLIVSILGDALGSLGLYQLYKVGISYDKILHFVTPFILTLSLSVIILKSYHKTPLTAVAIAFAIVVICAIDWELFEATCDNIFHTHLTGVYHTDIYNDTKHDLIFDGLGAISGVLAWLVATVLPKRKFPIPIPAHT